MELDSLWLTRLQQLIFKNYKNGIVDKIVLANDGFSEEFIQNAVKKGYINVCTTKNSYVMTDKLRYMPVTIAKFKLDSKNKANRIRGDDPQFMKATYEAAKQYHLAATILTANMGAVFEGERMPLIIPSFMVAAFSCELYLKAILLANGVHKTGHKLIYLFNELPHHDQQTIMNFFVEHGRAKEDALRDLDDMSEAFVGIRYSHERTGFFLNAQFLALFLEILYNQCKNAIPD